MEKSKEDALLKEESWATGLMLFPSSKLLIYRAITTTSTAATRQIIIQMK